MVVHNPFALSFRSQAEESAFRRHPVRVPTLIRPSLGNTGSERNHPMTFSVVKIFHSLLARCRSLSQNRTIAADNKALLHLSSEWQPACIYAGKEHGWYGHTRGATSWRSSRYSHASAASRRRPAITGFSQRPQGSA